MATTIKMPQLGESVTEGTIERWLVKVGDSVAQYDPLFEVVTDKVNAEVPAEVGGVVTKILVGDGQTVKVGTPLAEISENGEARRGGPGASAGSRARPSRPPQPSACPPEAPEPELEAPPASEAATGRRGRSLPPRPLPNPSRPEPAPEPALAEAPDPEPQPLAVATAVAEEDLATDGSMRMTPAVRRLVREHNLDVTEIPGTRGWWSRHP